MFKKPTSKDVKAKKYIKKLINSTLHKDLCENEEICPFCHGTGMAIVDNPYGLNGDPNKKIGVFPYKHESLTYCNHCYNGIVHRCHLCGEIMERCTLKHNCDKELELDKIEKFKKMQEEFDKAPIAPKEIEEKCQCFFSNDYTYNEGYFFEWEDFFDDWFNNHEDTDEKPEYVWITDAVDMNMDAEWYLERATEDLYEDAYYDISDEKIKELQDYLDNWCNNCGVGQTYWESHKYKVKIPWEE